MISKEDVRKSLRDQRSTISKELQKTSSDAIVRHFLRLRYGVCWLLYAPIQNEISTEPLFKLAHEQRKDRVYFPRIKNDSLSFHRVSSMSELTQGNLCLEPASRAEAWDPLQPTVIVVPGIAFSPRGDRLGFGKGYYDRFLAEHKHLPRLGMAYDFQIVRDSWKPEPTDQALDYVITPSAVWGSPRVIN